jgi:hypothetical protein
MVSLLKDVKITMKVRNMIKILARLLFSPLIIIISSLLGVFMLIHTIICEMKKILNY